MDTGPYTVFIVTAYAAAIVIVAGLVAWVLIDLRHLVRVIEEMEAQGVGRRSERKAEKKR
jgi:heme exporter protein D